MTIPTCTDDPKEGLALTARIKELERAQEAHMFLMDQSREVMRDCDCVYVELNAYLYGTASVDDILEVKAGHEAMKADT